jgi:outer membrane protein assembly factor BamB
MTTTIKSTLGLFSIVLLAHTPLAASTGGLIVHLGCGDGTQTAKLGAGDSCLVHGLDTDAEKVAAARKTIRAMGLYGKVSIDLYDGKTLPYIDNLVNRIVADGACDVPDGELLRVLRPSGVAELGGRKLVKPWPDTIDEWTHYLHDADNNAVAHDLEVGPPRHMQFLSDPLWTRHHDKLASVSTVVTAGGRMFYIIDEGPVYAPNAPGRWSVTARDAFNGVFLWKKTIPAWTSISRKFRSGPVQLQRLLVTDGERVYVTLGLDQPISVLDAASGEDLGVIEGTKSTEEILLHKGALVVLVGEQGAEQSLIESQKKPAFDYKKTKLIKAFDAKTGKQVWRWPAEGTTEIMPRTLGISAGRVFFQESGDTVCLDLRNGESKWRTPTAKMPAAKKPAAPSKKTDGKNKKKKRQPKSPDGRSMGWTYATLVAQEEVVLTCDGSTVKALDSATGKQLWEAAAKTPFGRTPSVDILVIDGVVWTSPGFGDGRDLKTGKVVASNNLQQELVTAGHHHRCYRNKGTDRFVIEGYRGLEFMDTEGDNHARHNWIRGLCQYGIMPANGLVYIPPHNCGCYPEAKLYGFWVLGAKSSLDTAKLQCGKSLEQGPAFKTAARKSKPANNRKVDWPTHRHDPGRSGVTTMALPAKLKPGWKAGAYGRLSAPVISGGTLLVSAPASHQVLAFDAESGDELWAVTAGGPVDSAPTIHGDTALFGSADGTVSCVGLDDGELVWRFRAAPLDRRTVALQQVESLWPVHGSILVKDDTAWFSAGRSTYIDGGLFLYAVDAGTGTVKSAKRLDSPHAGAQKPDGGVAADGFSQNKVDYKTIQGPDRSDAFSMAEGNISDILVADESGIYLRHMKFDGKWEAQSTRTHHLLSTSRLLDDNESHRSHWFFGNGDFSRLPVAYEWLTRGSYGGFDTPVGKLLVYDRETCWGTMEKRGAQSLFAFDIRDIDQKLTKDFPKRNTLPQKVLIEKLDLHPRAMIKAGKHLVIGGFLHSETAIHAYGKPIEEKGAVIQVAADTGKIVSRIDLDSPPVFDGLAAANGKLYLSCEDGSVICLR